MGKFFWYNDYIYREEFDVFCDFGIMSKCSVIFGIEVGTEVRKRGFGFIGFVSKLSVLFNFFGYFFLFV